MARFRDTPADSPFPEPVEEAGSAQNVAAGGSEAYGRYGSERGGIEVGLSGTVSAEYVDGLGDLIGGLRVTG